MRTDCRKLKFSGANNPDYEVEDWTRKIVNLKAGISYIYVFESRFIVS